MTLADDERRIVYFSGTVQGVGFRYTTARVAERFTVTGFVQNLSDGRVLVIAEGTAPELDRFIGAVQAAMRDSIDPPLIGDVIFLHRQHKPGATCCVGRLPNDTTRS